MEEIEVWFEREFMVNDVSSPFGDPQQEYRDMIRVGIHRVLELQPKFGKRYIKKHKVE